MQFISEFIESMESVGIKPTRSTDIKVSKSIVRFHIEGDSKASKNGRYQIFDHGDGFAGGWFMDMKDGFCHKWHTKAQKQFTDEERREWVKKREADKLQFEKEQQERHEKSALIANDIWKAAGKGEHTYLNDKQIDILGAKFSSELKIENKTYSDILIVPAWKAGKISTLQFITKDGFKWFLGGGDIIGSYGSVGKDTSKIYISEGFATAKSIHKCVTPYVSVWAFNAGNLMAVSKTMREKYPDSEIIICADNDQWTTIRDKPHNTGLIKATEAAFELCVPMIAPDVPADDEGKRTDFNDLYCTQGLEYVKNRLSEASLVPTDGGVVPLFGNVVFSSDNDSPPPLEFAPLESYDLETPEDKQRINEDNWQEYLVNDAKGRLVKTSLRNTILLTKYLSQTKDVFRYNEFRHEITVAKCPPWIHYNDFEVHELDDYDITQMTSTLETAEISPNTSNVHRAIEVVAKENSFHPARDYLEGLQWDGKERLKTWLSYYLGAENEDHEYLSIVGTKWLVAAVNRLYKAGCDFHHVLVLEGKQGAGKSTALRELATFGTAKKEAYFTDQVGISDIHNKDTIKMLQGSIIVELAELAGFNKKEDEEIKSWITSPVDQTRLPYARTPVKFPRQFVLSATTNSYDYLKDPTGNRRYWPVEVGSIDLGAIREDRMQLWAEAVALYREGHTIYLDSDGAELATREQEKRRSVDAWEDDVLDVISNLGMSAQEGFKIEKIMRGLQLGLKDRDFKAQRRISSILQSNGYVSAVKSKNGKSSRIWKKEN